MKIIDLIYLSVENFRSRKQRIIFTILGVSIGIGAILFLVSLGFGLQKNLLEQITTAESLLTLDITPVEEEAISLTPDSLKTISKFPEVEKISPQAVLQGQTMFKELTSEITLNIVEPDWFQLTGNLTSSGRIFNKEDKGKVIVNSTIIELFNLKPEEILGKKFKIIFFNQENKALKDKKINYEKEFEVIGLFQEEDVSPQAYLKLDDLQELTIEKFQFAKAKIKTSKEIQSAREKLISMGFLVSALSDTIDQANKVFKIIQIILGIFGVVALIVAAIGLINTMTITLLERVKEIGIMRAIGASPHDIKWFFLGESTITGFLGGIGGIAIGFIASKIFNWILNILANTLGGDQVNLFAYPFWFIIFIIILSTCVGFIAGFWPAHRASKLNPLDALRYK
ncbi:ABC transporter permease [Patescibacteria group bacterium]|nr:ABC transporter permease [Patescibacteria group bacterium]MBU1684393.1 ABC transporter permease [Patescibacteria group bacterium]